MGKSSKFPSISHKHSASSSGSSSSSSVGSTSASGKSVSADGNGVGKNGGSVRKTGGAGEMSEFIDWESELGVSSDSIDDDIKGTDEVKVLSRLHKTDEEIQQLSIDADLDEVSRALLILRNGQNIQLPAILSSLPRLLIQRRKETLSQIIPLLLDSLHSHPSEFQMMAAGTMYDVIDKGLIPEAVVDEVYACATKLLCNKDENISAVWGDVLIISIKSMSQKAIYDSILPGCLAYSGLSQPVPLRIWSCRMLGAVVSRLKSSEIETLFQRAITLCQDTDYEVRACMCHQLNEFAKHVKLDSVRRSLFHEYVELIIDEEDYVREAALANLVKSAEFVDDTAKSNIIVPIWKKLCSEKPARLMELMARDFGLFFYHCKSVLPEDAVKFFMEFYQSTALSTEEDLRIWSAYNFPGILKTVGPEMYEQLRLDQILLHLSVDSSIDVKRRITCGFHEIVDILDRQSQSLVRPIFLRLLSNPEVDVYEPLFKNLNVILKGFALDETGRRTAQFDELLFSILRKEREYASNASYKLVWRIHHDLLNQFKHFIDYFDSEYIHDQCVPLLFKLLSDNITIPIKKTIIETLCIYLRKMRRLENRIKMIRSIADLRESPSFHTRLIFIWTLQELYNHFSHRFIRETFFDEFLDMARDPVPNIRISFVALSPQFRKSLLRGFHNTQQQQQQNQFSSVSGSSTVGFPNPNLKSSSNHFQQHQAAVIANMTRLNECLMALSGDADRDVSGLAQDELERCGLGTRRTVKSLAAAAVTVSTANVGGFEPLDLKSGYGVSNEDADEDKDREEFEERLLAQEIEDDSTSVRRKDDDFVSGGRSAAGKRLSMVSRHGTVKTGGASIQSMASAGHRKLGGGSTKTGSAVPAKQSSAAAPLNNYGLGAQRVLGQPNRVTAGANHGSLGQLSSIGSSPPEAVKRGKSAGPTEKRPPVSGSKTQGAINSGMTGNKGESDGYTPAPSELGPSGKKKSLSSLVASAAKNGPLKTISTMASGYQSGQRRDVQNVALTPRNTQLSPSSSRNQIEPTNSASSNRSTVGYSGGGGSGVAKPFGGSGGMQPQRGGTVKQLPPLSPSAVDPYSKKH
ncbi:Serine/threonine-protein phosphatase 4 regulatory subunit 4 [Chytriomyces hyalinus]|nr:Serine/threonine-protein phosphatase 4 regulatory subunit 4 [Chytriomyces hyalinus]